MIFHRDNFIIIYLQMKTSIIYTAVVLALLGFAASTEPGLFLDEDQTSGLVNLSKGDDMFYWFFKSRNDPSTDPLVLWLTGGPGCSSGIAVFYENGPFSFNDDLSLKKNPYSWNTAANLLYVDSPVGTGFSKCSSITHLDTNEDEVAQDIE